MRKGLDLITRYLSTCLNCGSFLTQDSGLCGACLENLERWRSAKPLVVKPLTVYAHYEWTPGASDSLSHLLLMLKGPYRKQSWEFYARRFAKDRLRDVTSFRRIYIVPAPSKDQKTDHAALWARALSATLGATYFPCLAPRSGGAPQKYGDISERALIEFEVLENNTVMSNFPGSALWVFADDIVTTGATARAAYRALGCPTHFVVWSLAYRHLSCGASRDLLYNGNV